MEKKEILEKLQEIIRETIDNDDVLVTNDTIATDVDGWDSLAQVMIIGEIRNQFGVKLTASEVATLANVGAMVDAISSKL